MFMATFCFAIIYSGTAFAAGRRGRGAMRGVRKVKAMKVIQPAGSLFISRPVIQPVILKPVAPVLLKPTPVAIKKPHEGPEVGLSAGLFSQIPSLAGEIWFHKILGLEGTGVKAGLRYAQGNDANSTPRKNALICVDGTINLNEGPGAIFYVAGGLNYLAYTTGQTSGTVGAEVYLGVQEGSLAYGSLYAEAGYSAIRTGFSPSYKGLDLNLGFKWAY